MTASERAVLVAVLEHAWFAGRDELLAQVNFAWVTGKCDCGCPTVYLEVDGAAPRAAGVTRPVQNGADVLRADGTECGGVILFADEGWLSSLEVYWYEDRIKEMPAVAELRLLPVLPGG